MTLPYNIGIGNDTEPPTQGCWFTSSVRNALPAGAARIRGREGQ